jgi:hypothetical protein
MVKMRSSTYLAAWKLKAINNQQHHKHHEFALLCSLWCLHSLSLSLSLWGLAVQNNFYSVSIGFTQILQEEGSDLCTWEQPLKLAFAVRGSIPSSLKFGSLFPGKAVQARRFSSRLGLRSSTGVVPTSVGRLLRKWPIIEQGWRKSRSFIIGWKVRFEVGLRTWQTPYLSVWYTSSVETPQDPFADPLIS